MKIITQILSESIANVWKTKKWKDFTTLLDKLNALGEVTAIEREDGKKIFLYLNDKFINTMPVFYWIDNKKVLWSEALDNDENKGKTNPDERVGSC